MTLYSRILYFISPATIIHLSDVLILSVMNTMQYEKLKYEVRKF
jgi:hypothetical protein